MSKAPNPPSAGDNETITILLVDDIPETRENIKKMIAFEPDLKVVGAAGTGREGVAMAEELKPNIIIMDINMPDMDGIEATTLITEKVPSAAVIMMSVQNDPDYLRRAMLAGARNFLTKPIAMEELYNTIRTVHKRHQAVAPPQTAVRTESNRPVKSVQGPVTRAGNIIVVYSPQGGVGTTTIATSLASGLMKEGIRVLLVDADLQFGDVGAILNLSSQSTMVELIPDVDDLDTDLFENIVATHDSGLKVLLGPSRPEFAEEVLSNPSALPTILQKVANNYDFIVVDTSNHLDEMLLSLLDIANRIVLVGTPTLSCVKNIRFMLDLFDKLQYPQEKTVLVLNRIPEDRQLKRLIIATERIESYLKRSVDGRIPMEELFVLKAVNKAVPVIAAERDKTRPPIRELMDLSTMIFTSLMDDDESEEEMPDLDESRKKRTGLGLRLGR
jgi:pilus assembly protein CpaE